MEPDKYLYFYSCSNSVCTTTENIINYKSKYKCENACPVVTEIIDEENVKIKLNNIEIKYNYIKGVANNGE